MRMLRAARGAFPCGYRQQRPGRRLARKSPAQGLAGVERHHPLDLIRHRRLPAFQGYHLLVERKAVEARAIDRGEGLELIERIFFLEDRRIAFEGKRRVEDACAAARTLLGVALMRRAVRPEEDPRMPGRRKSAHREPVLLAFRNRQAVGMGPEATREHGIAVDYEMLGRDGRRDPATAHEID